MATESGSHGEFSFHLPHADIVLDVPDTPTDDDGGTTDDPVVIPPDDFSNDTFQFFGDFTGQSASIFDETSQFDAHIEGDETVHYSVVFEPTSTDVWTMDWNSSLNELSIRHNGVDLL